MFENAEADELLAAVAACDFDADVADFGAAGIDAITAFDRVICAAHARQAAQIAALDAKRSAQMSMHEGDQSLSVIGEVAMARNISRSAAGNQYCPLCQSGCALGGMGQEVLGGLCFAGK